MKKLHQRIKDVFTNLNDLPTVKSQKILENCGKICGVTDKLQEEALSIRSEVNDTSDLNLLFLVFKEKVYKNNPRLYKTENTIYLEYHQCECPIVNKGKINDPFFCNCTRGYTKLRFETLFDKPIEVVLEKSILKGDNICRLKIMVDGLSPE